MTNEKFSQYCLAKKGAYADFPFGEGFLVFKVKKRIFAQIFLLKGVETVTLNCSPGGGLYYRSKFEGVVTRGYHCPPVQQPHFISMPTAKIPDETLLQMLEESYRTVVGKLSKAYQQELLNE